MKSKLITISIFLVLAITISMLTGMVSSSSYSDERRETLNDCFADNKTANVFVAPDIIEQDELETTDYVGRVPEEEKDLYTFIFKNGDGSNTMRVFSHPVKYVDDNGATRDISLEISSNKDGSFYAADHMVDAYFGSSITDGIDLEYNDVKISMKVLDANENVSVDISDDGKKLTYAVDNKTSYVYSLTYLGIKEDIVVSEYTGQTEYKFALFTHGLHPVKIDDSVFLADVGGDIKATIGDIIIFTADERNNTFGDLLFESITENEEYIFTIILDQAYLKNEKTVYPITIDPTIEISYNNNGAGAIEDVTINENVTFSGTSGSLYVGRHPAGSLSRTLMRFPNLSLYNLTADQITSAAVEIRDLMCQGDEDIRIECYVYKNTAPSWSENSTTTWNSVGTDYIGSYLSGHTVSYGEGNVSAHRYGFSITSLVKAWINSTQSPSKGIVFKASNAFETQTGSDIQYWYKTFSSYNRSGNYRPSLSIVYKPIYEYVYKEDAPIQYTYFATLSLTAGETITISTQKATSYDNVDTVLHLFYKSSPSLSNSWANDDYNNTHYSQLTATIPTTGEYLLLVRCFGNTTGYCNVYKNGVLFKENAQLGGYRFVCNSITGIQNFFTANSSGVDTVLYVMDSSYRVLAYNDDYRYDDSATNGDFNWGRHSRIHKNFTTSPKYVFVAAYGPSQVGTADIYANCGDGYTNVGDFPSLKAIDSIKAESATGYTYNCIAWSGGIAHRWINPFYYPETNPYYLSYMEPWYNADPVVAFDNFYGNNPQRYAGATTYVNTTNSSESIVDVYYSNSNEEWTHASVKRPGNDMPHGYAWESKLGPNERIFHPRNALEGGSYGSIARYYKVIEPSASSYSNSLVSGISYDESISMGLTKEMVISINDSELLELQRNISANTSELLKEFKYAYNAWVDKANKISLQSASSGVSYTRLEEFVTLKELIDANYTLVFNVIDLYIQNQDLFTRTLFEATVVSYNDKTLALANTVREKNNAISQKSLNDSIYIAPSFEANAMTFIKTFLDNPTEFLDKHEDTDSFLIDADLDVKTKCHFFEKAISNNKKEEFDNAYSAWNKKAMESCSSSSRTFLKFDEFYELKELIQSDISYKYLALEKCYNSIDTPDELLCALILYDIVLAENEETKEISQSLCYRDLIKELIDNPDKYFA